MLDFVLLGLCIAFLISTVWLWYIGKSVDRRLIIAASVVPRPHVMGFPEYQPNQLRFLSWALQESLPRLAALSGVCILALAIAFALAGFANPILSLIIMVWILLTIFLVLARFVVLSQRHIESETDFNRAVTLDYMIHYGGAGHFPEKVYQGDSKNIAIKLESTLLLPEGEEQPLQVRDVRGGKSIILHINRKDGIEQYLEIELIAAGFVVDGEKKQKQRLISNSLQYQWNCYFPHSGNHAVMVIFRLIAPPDELLVGSFEHTIMVAKLDHMTQQQLWILTTIAGVVTGMLAIAEALRRLGFW